MNRSREIFVGVGLGGLVGLLIGLSSSEVVGMVVGALTALLGAFFGLKSDKEDAAPAQSGRAVRIGAFGIAGVVAILFGLFVRAHNLLGQSPEALADDWRKAGFGIEQARELAAYQRLGVLTGDWRVANEKIAQTAGTTGMSILFSQDKPSECASLEANRHANAAERLRAFQLADDPAWRQIAGAAEGLSGDALAKALEASWRRLCQDMP